MLSWSLKLLGQLVNLCKEIGTVRVVLGPETCSTKQASSSAFVVMTERLKRSLLILSSDNFPNSFVLMNWWNSLLQRNKQFYMGRGIKLGSDVGFAIPDQKSRWSSSVWCFLTAVIWHGHWNWNTRNGWKSRWSMLLYGNENLNNAACRTRLWTRNVYMNSYVL